MVRKTRTDIPSSGNGAGEGSGSQNLGSGRRDGAQSSTASRQHGGTHHPAAPQQHGGAQYSQVPRQQGGAGRGWGPGNPQKLGRRGGVNTGDGAYAPVGRGVGPSTPPVPELHQATQPPHEATSASLPEASSSSPDVALAEHVGKLSLQAEPAASQAMVPASSKSMRFPLRPSKGSCGTKCVVKANHFFVELLKKDLHQYDVSITPKVTSRGVNRAVMKELVRVFTESRLGGRLPAYDGRKSLYTAGPLPFTFNEFQVTLVDEDDGNGPERRPRNFRIVIKLAARVDLHHLEMYLTGKQAVAPQEALRVLAIVLRELPNARYSPVGRCFYSPNLGRRQPLGEGIESWRGFYQSIRPTQMGLSLIIGFSYHGIRAALGIVLSILFQSVKMASEASSQVTRTEDVYSSDNLIPPSLKFVMNSIKIISNTPLTSDNYLIWNAQITKLFRANGFASYLDGTLPCPPKLIPDSAGVLLPNPSYNVWQLVDQNLSAALFATISPQILPHVLTLDTTAAIWSTLARRLQSTTRSRVIQLKNELHQISMKNNSMSQYLSEVKNIVDQLHAAGASVDSEDVILYILNGLPPLYQSFKTAIRTRLEPIPLEDFYSLLCSEETNIALEASRDSATQLQALYSSRGRSSRGSFRGRGRFSQRGGRSSQADRASRTSNSPLTCQICSKPGHSARVCWYRSSNDSSIPPTGSTALIADSTITPSTDSDEWYIDSGASAHLTPHLRNLQIPTHYHGSDSITVGNGHSIPITHTGQSVITTPNSKFHLTKLLHVPSLQHNLLSVHDFTSDNNCSILFNSSGFQIKDRRTNRVLHQGPCRNGLYPLFPTKALSASLHSSTLWHQRLGHPNAETLRLIAKLHTNLHIPNIVNCNTCNSAKSHKLPFSSSSSRSSTCFDLVHSDVWGPAPVVSIQGFHYYVIFIDDFSRFVWLYPLFKKSDVCAAFIHFHKMVTNTFHTNIKTFRSDGGGEYTSTSFKNYLLSHGIHHQFSSPYTPEQNGVSERKHRHIFETCRTLLHGASLPLKFWMDATLTATYLINRLPSKVTSMISPYQLLYHKPPTYLHLRIFGSSCFPWQAPLISNKLLPRAPHCIFLGYSSSHKAYKCFDPQTHKLIFSRHVKFDESTFPCVSTLSSPTTLPSSSTTISPLIFTPLSSPAQLPSSSITPPSPVPSTTSTNTPPFLSPLSDYSASPSLPSSHSSIVPPTLPIHPMQTRLKSGITKPKSIFNLQHILTTPTSYSQATQHHQWREAMSREFQALQQQGTWQLVPPPLHQQVLGSKWIFKTKLHPDGSPAQYKARLVAQGFNQEHGLDFHETFSPVAKLTTIRCFLTIAVYHHWGIHQLDISNAFLYGSLNEIVYMSQPKGFEDTSHPNYVCLLRKAIYGLKQAPRQWNETFTKFLHTLGFASSSADTSLLIKRTMNGCIYILLYVDDFLITGPPQDDISSLVTTLSNQFRLKNLGFPAKFLGIQIHRTSSGLFLNQPGYILKLLHMAGMSDCKSTATPAAITSPKFCTSSTTFANPTFYRQLAGSLQFLTITRPDIAYAVNRVCQHMHAPQDCHFAYITRILRYLQGTLQFGIPIQPTSLQLSAYSDSDWAGDQLDRKSTSGFCVFLGNTIISWKVQKQKSVARSSSEAEYRALASVTVELIWLQRLLQEFGLAPISPTNIYCDNTSAIAIANNPILHARTKHVEIDHHFIRENILSGLISVHHISTVDQVADILTKPLSISKFRLLRNKLTIQSLDSHLEGGC